MSTRRALLRSSLGLPLVLASAHTTTAQTPSPVSDGDHDHESPHSKLLAVADTDAATLAVFDIDSGSLQFSLPDVAVNAHAGFIPLPDGQLLCVDDAAGRLLAMEAHGDHAHIHEAVLPGTAWSHIAIDSDHAHLAAVGTDDPSSPIVLIDLESWETIPVALPEAGEVGLMLSHDYLFHRNDVSSQLEVYALDDIRNGSLNLISSVQIGPGGHGESITMNGDTLYIATEEGIDAVAWDESALTFLTTYAWNTTERTGGRGYFQRLSFDGSRVISYTADRSAADWTSWANDAFVVNTQSHEASRTEIGSGYVYRFGLSEAHALFYRIGREGDEAVLLDLESGSIATRIALPSMSAGPKPEDDIYAVGQYRAVACDPHGEFGFVTQGGDGLVQVLDLHLGEISTVIETGTPLNGGGYLTVFGNTASFTDTIGR